MCSPVVPPSDLSDAELRDATTDAQRVFEQTELHRAALLAEVDRRDATVAIGETSTSGWIRAESWAGHGEAVRIVGLARQLDRFTVIREAVVDGTITLAVARTLFRACNKRTVDAFDADQANLVEWATGLSVAQTRTLVAYWKAHTDLDGTEPEDEPTGSRLTARTLLDSDRGELVADLTAEDAAIVFAELDRIATLLHRSEDADRTPDEPELDVPPGSDRSKQRLAAALVQMARRSSGPDRTSAKPLVQVVVPLATMEGTSDQPGIGLDGRTIPARAIREWACEGDLCRIVLDAKGAIVDVGHNERFFTPEQHRLLALRDGGCAWPGCGLPPAWCIAHHVDPWPDGPTDLANGCLLCLRHHRLAHSPGWTLRWAKAGSAWAIEAVRPDSKVLKRPRPPGPLPAWAEPGRLDQFVERLRLVPMPTDPPRFEPTPTWRPGDPFDENDRLVADALNFLHAGDRIVTTQAMSITRDGVRLHFEISHHPDHPGHDLITRTRNGAIWNIERYATADEAYRRLQQHLTQFDAAKFVG